MFGYKNLEEFKEENGYEIDGTWFPRVTQIAGIKSKPALHYYYASLSSYKQGERIKEKAAKEGTMVHEAIQDLLVGNEHNVDSSIKPSVDAFFEYNERKGIEIEPEYIEKRVVHKDHKFAGTVDALATIDGKVGVLDIKTSQSIYRDYRLQTSAYMASLIDEVDDIETRWILRVDQHKLCENCGARLRNKGGRKKVKIDWKNSFMRNCKHEWGEVVGDIELKEFPKWKDDFQAFLGAKRLWEWENKEWLDKLGYEPTVDL